MDQRRDSRAAAPPAAGRAARPASPPAPQPAPPRCALGLPASRTATGTRPCQCPRWWQLHRSHRSLIPQSVGPLEDGSPKQESRDRGGPGQSTGGQGPASRLLCSHLRVPGTHRLLMTGTAQRSSRDCWGHHPAARWIPGSSRQCRGHWACPPWRPVSSVAPWPGSEGEGRTASGVGSEAGGLPPSPVALPALWPPGRPRPAALHPTSAGLPTQEQALAHPRGRTSHEARAVRTHVPSCSLLGQFFLGNAMCDDPDLGKLVPHRAPEPVDGGGCRQPPLTEARGPRRAVGASDRTATRGFIAPVQGQCPQGTGATWGARPP